MKLNYTHIKNIFKIGNRYFSLTKKAKETYIHYYVPLNEFNSNLMNCYSPIIYSNIEEAVENLYTFASNNGYSYNKNGSLKCNKTNDIYHKIMDHSIIIDNNRHEINTVSFVFNKINLELKVFEKCIEFLMNLNIINEIKKEDIPEEI